MSKHTPGPWMVYDEVPPGGGVAIGPEDETDDMLGKPFGLAMVTYNGGNSDANAQRIVACVNACEGINPEAVEELVEAAEKGLTWVVSLLETPEELSARAHHRLEMVRDNFRAALAKAEGGGS